MYCCKWPALFVRSNRGRYVIHSFLQCFFVLMLNIRTITRHHLHHIFDLYSIAAAGSTSLSLLMAQAGASSTVLEYSCTHVFPLFSTIVFPPFLQQPLDHILTTRHRIVLHTYHKLKLITTSSPSIALLNASQIRVRINSRLRRSPRVITSAPPHHLLRLRRHSAAALAFCSHPQCAFNDHSML